MKTIQFCYFSAKGLPTEGAENKKFPATLKIINIVRVSKSHYGMIYPSFYITKIRRALKD
jgi:hypothetical protein